MYEYALKYVQEKNMLIPDAIYRGVTTGILATIPIDRGKTEVVSLQHILVSDQTAAMSVSATATDGDVQDAIVR